MEENKNYIRGCKALELRYYETAINYFTKAINEDPNDLQSLIKRADTYDKVKDYDNYANDLFLQSKLYTKQLKANPNNYEILYKRGEIYRYLDKKKRATADYEKAIKLNPKYIEAYIGLGYVKSYPGKDELNQALSAFFQAIYLQPNNSQALYNIGQIYLRQKDTEKAIEFYKKCIETKGDYLALACRSLGGLYSQMNRFKEGIALYKKFLSNSGYDGDCRYLASLYEKAGDLNKALFHLNMAISIDNGVPFTYFRLSEIYMNIGNFEMALKNINIALSIHNKKSFLHFKAKLLLKLKKIEEAELVFDEVISSWQVDYNKLKRLAFKRGISYRDIWSL